MRVKAKTRNLIFRAVATMLAIVFVSTIGITFATTLYDKNFISNVPSTRAYTINQEYKIINDTLTTPIPYGVGTKNYQVAMEYSYGYDFDVYFEYSLVWNIPFVANHFYKYENSTFTALASKPDNWETNATDYFYYSQTCSNSSVYYQPITTENVILNFSNRDDFIVDNQYIYYKNTISAGTGKFVIISGIDFANYDNAEYYKATLTIKIDAVHIEKETGYDTNHSFYSAGRATSIAWLKAKNNSDDTTYAMVYSCVTDKDNGVKYPTTTARLKDGSNDGLGKALNGNKSYAGIGIYVVTGNSSALTLKASVLGNWVPVTSGSNLVYIDNINANFNSDWTFQGYTNNGSPLYYYSKQIPANTTAYIPMIESIEISTEGLDYGADYSDYRAVLDLTINGVAFNASSFTNNMIVNSNLVDGGLGVLSDYAQANVTVNNPTSYVSNLYKLDSLPTVNAQTYYTNITLTNNTSSDLTANVSYVLNYYINNGQTKPETLQILDNKPTNYSTLYTQVFKRNGNYNLKATSSWSATAYNYTYSSEYVLTDGTEPADWSSNWSAYYLSDNIVRTNTSDFFNPTSYRTYYESPALVNSKPTDWAGCYDYFKLSGSAGSYVYTQNPTTIWAENTYYSLTPSVVSSEPVDFATNYQNYYIRTGSSGNYVYTQNSSTTWDGSKDYYTLVATTVNTKPADWAGYLNYFKQVGATYVENNDTTWAAGTFYSLSEVLSKPANWDSNYSSYLVKEKYVANTNLTYDNTKTYYAYNIVQYNFSSDIWYKAKLVGSTQLEAGLPSSVVIPAYGSVTCASSFGVAAGLYDLYKTSYGNYEVWVELVPTVTSTNSTTAVNMQIEGTRTGSTVEIRVKNNTNSPIKLATNPTIALSEFTGSTITSSNIADLTTIVSLAFDNYVVLMPNESIKVATATYSGSNTLYFDGCSSTGAVHSVTTPSLVNSGTENAYIINTTANSYYIRFTGTYLGSKSNIIKKDNSVLSSIVNNTYNYYIGVLRPNQCLDLPMSVLGSLEYIQVGVTSSKMDLYSASAISSWFDGTTPEVIDNLYLEYFN